MRTTRCLRIGVPQLVNGRMHKYGWCEMRRTTTLDRMYTPTAMVECCYTASCTQQSPEKRLKLADRQARTAREWYKVVASLSIVRSLEHNHKA